MSFPLEVVAELLLANAEWDRGTREYSCRVNGLLVFSKDRKALKNSIVAELESMAEKLAPAPESRLDEKFVNEAVQAVRDGKHALLTAQMIQEQREFTAAHPLPPILPEPIPAGWKRWEAREGDAWPIWFRQRGLGEIKWGRDMEHIPGRVSAGGAEYAQKFETIVPNSYDPDNPPKQDIPAAQLSFGEQAERAGYNPKDL